MEPSIKFPATVAIGFTGHRTLDDEAKCRKSIFDFLEQQKASLSGLVYGISSVAAGGDLLFAESCIQLALPLCVLLPLPAEEFRKDFDKEGWSRAEQILSKAASIEVTGGDQPREECYYECGIETVQQSQLLLALWNGEPSQGLGGTEDIVSFARGFGKPVVWLHSTTGEVSIFNKKTEQELQDDPELEFLNRLPDENVSVESNKPEALARAWFRKVDESATRCAPQFRRLAAIPIIFTAAAALFSGAGSWAHQVGTWLAIGTALGILAAFLPVALRLQKRQILWVRTRTAAEVCRSVLAFWSTPTPYEAIGPEVVPELSGVLRSLNLLKALDRGRGKVSLEEFKQRYRRERVANQLKYLFDHAAQSAAEARKYRAATWACIGLAVALNVWLFVSGRLIGGIGPGPWKQGLALGASIAFQIATVAGALLAVNDCDRRRERYRELHQQLGEWDAQLETLRTWPSVLRVAGRIEQALLTELIEWRSLIRNHKQARK
ncbi:MAG: hypothetical protein WCA89_14065 [Terracidiphilus sp.]|jgi:hypothetical protein